MPSTTITDIVLDQWIDLGANRCRSISATALSESPEPPPPVEEDDMPLNAAIYDSGRDVIFAVRGGYVFKLNATTGALIATARYTFPTWDTAGIVLAANVDKLYCSYWHEPTADGVAPISGLFRINPDTLVLEGFVDLTGDIDADFGSGPMGIVYVGGFIFGIGRVISGQNIVIFKYNTSTDAFVNLVNFDGPTTTLESQVAVKASDSSLSVVSRSRVRNYTSAGLVFNFFTGNFFLSTGHTGYGFAHDLVNAQYYVVCNSQFVVKSAASAASVASVIDTARVDLTPRRAAWNSVDGKVYIPGGKDNSVVVIDPASADAVTVKTGFDSPIDMVFTPTKIWAVQHGAKGLKEVV